MDHPEIQAAFGQDRPENIVQVSETAFWVIEAKREQRELDKAIAEAEDYARRINAQPNIGAPFISGVAGNAGTGYLMRTSFLVRNRYVPVTFNEKDISSLIGPDVALTIIERGPHIADVPIDEKLFLSKAERINGHLHAGAINKNDRARLMAALLLSLIEETPPNVNAAPSILIHEINARAERVLKREAKGDFFRYIEITLPPTEDNHVKYKAALVRTIQELNILNIRSAMKSGADVLGKFYEVFLKYGNGAKEIGIVLTPRHVTRFAVEVVGVSHQDVVFDPTCGTGGFLVAAFDHVRRVSNDSQVKRFKRENLLGVEQDAGVVSLAIVNMIFRGDGKNKIIEGDCFQKHIAHGARNAPEFVKEQPPEEQLAVTRVLMNPPFLGKEGKGEKEYLFVDHALSQMQDGGVLFSVLPYPAMVKSSGYKHWRKASLLAKNTLLCVITFPADLFYPIGTHTVGVFVKKGAPHPLQQNVLWVRTVNDGLLKSKGKRLPSVRTTNDLETVRTLVKAFLVDPSHPVPSIDRIQKACPIDWNDPLLELVPENYLDETPPTEREIQAEMEKVIRKTMAFLIEEGRSE